MKTLTLTIILTTNAIIGFGQNLISNWTFENALQKNCQGWFDGCGNEITYICDTILPYCQVGFLQESPSPSQWEMWSLKLDAGFPQEGLAETYITGQSGTKIYQLKYWMKSPDSWFGSASIGTISQNQFNASKTITDTTFLWKEYTLIDTITTQTNDTIAVRLSAGVGDFCVCISYFDLIELTVIGTLSSIDDINQFANNITKVYPNPTTDNVTIEITDNKNENRTLTIYSSIGQSVKTIQSSGNIFSIDSKDIANGLYFYQVQITADKKIIGQGKLVFE